MNRIIHGKLLVMVLLVVFMASSISYAEEVEIKEDITPAITAGQAIGYKIGKELGIENASQFPPIAAEDVIPTDSEITDNNFTLLDGESLEYKEAFVKAFKDGFNKGYKETVVKISYGAILGIAQGEIQGANDFYNNIASNWEKHLPSDKEITEQFNLGLETKLYKNNFLSAFKEGYSKGYAQSYENVNLGPTKTAFERGKSDGKSLGTAMGNIAGASDYYSNNKLNAHKNMPTDYNIIIDYNLNNDTAEYRESFVSSFKQSYIDSYTKSFRDVTVNTKLNDNKTAYDNGSNIGKINGGALAKVDYTLKKQNNWESHRINDIEIINDYELHLQSDKYRKDFIAGYWAGFSESYKQTFISLSQQQSTSKVTVEDVKLVGGTVQQEGITVNIPKGTLYNPITVRIKSSTQVPNDITIKNTAVTKGLIKTSKFYEVEIINPTNMSNDKFPVTISFEYYGDNSAGIYKLTNGYWTYVPSQIKADNGKPSEEFDNATATDGKISTTLKLSSITDSKFIVMVEEDMKAFYDIRGHWAKDEIDTYIRKKVITGYPDGTFKPNNNITRLEFLILLSRQHKWDMSQPQFGNVINFKDAQKFKGYDSIINYSAKQGYIVGYPDGTFKPNDNISYKEIQIIMKRVMQDNTFEWKNVAESIKMYKNYLSKSYTDINNKITRSEVIYMLYKLNEGKM